MRPSREERPFDSCNLKIIASMIVLSLFSLINAINLFKEKEKIILLSATVAEFLFSIVILLLTLYRTFRKPAALYLCNGKILLNGATSQAEEIKVIMKMGYFRPIIGIKPSGVNIVSINMCFRFSDDEEIGITDMVNWAEKNNVEMVNKSFLKWI